MIFQGLDGVSTSWRRIKLFNLRGSIGASAFTVAAAAAEKADATRRVGALGKLLDYYDENIDNSDLLDSSLLEWDTKYEALIDDIFAITKRGASNLVDTVGDALNPLGNVFKYLPYIAVGLAVLFVWNVSRGFKLPGTR